MKLLTHSPDRRLTFLCLGFVILTSFFTYFYRYDLPKAVFWDENYHIAAAQKYLNGIYFMEPHPPLGKLLIALGEKMINANPGLDNDFIGTDYGRTFGSGFSFAGYRFFPALLAWLTAPLLFLLFLVLTKNRWHATLASFLYIFDTALIVHLRGAMLEGPLLFFCVATVLGAASLVANKNDLRRVGWLSLLFGVSFACTVGTKITGLIFLLLVPFLLWQLRGNARVVGRFVLVSAWSFLLVYCAIWQIHFALGKTVNPSLPDNGFYQASLPYQAILSSGKAGSLGSFPLAMLDHQKFVDHYEAGAPRLDLCKVDENGSPWFLWPIGARTINYRWETPGNGAYRYLYLVSNPVVWFAGLAALLIAIALLAVDWLVGCKAPLKHREWMLLFCGLYVAYMIAISRIDRVLYLYHYFIPLLFTFFLVPLVIDNIQRIGAKSIGKDGRTMGLLLLAVLVLIGFQIYRPFAYYEPLTQKQLQRRDIIRLWDLTCIGCTKESLLVIPRT